MGWVPFKTPGRIPPALAPAVDDLSPDEVRRVLRDALQAMTDLRSDVNDKLADLTIELHHIRVHMAGAASQLATIETYSQATRMLVLDALSHDSEV